jgi:hypothetical protein
MTNGQSFTLWSIRMATAFYVVALSLCLVRANRRWKAAFRLAWTAGCILYLTHVWGAFQFFHSWSHLAAYRETARRTRELFGIEWGGGLYFNYLFSLVWLADTVWLWKSLDTYHHRPSWVGTAIHAFLAFMFFNATVIFASGFSRWLGVAATTALVLLWLRARTLGPSGPMLRNEMKVRK